MRRGWLLEGKVGSNTNGPSLECGNINIKPTRWSWIYANKNLGKKYAGEIKLVVSPY